MAVPGAKGSPAGAGAAEGHDVNAQTWTSPPLVARDDELTAFEAAWAMSHCRGVAIHGPAGVGKTRLAEECLARAVDKGFQPGRATASAVAAAVPLGAIAHLVPADTDLTDPVRGYQDVARALAGDGRRHVLFIDDLHLLDAASARFVQQLLDASAIRLIATVRTGEPVAEAVAALTLSETLHRIDLVPFDQQEVEEVLQATLGGPIGRHTVHTLHHVSGGNALYLRELVHGARSGGTLTRDGDFWELTEGVLPSTPRLLHLITARLEAVAPADRRVLELLALCEPLTSADAGPAPTLCRLEADGLIRAHLEGRRTIITLSHPLYGEALRRDMPLLHRRDLLLEQCTRVRDHGARRREDTLHLATWSLAATGKADPALLVRAAALAQHAHDHRQALDLTEAAWREERSAAVGLAHARALINLARHDEAEPVLREVEKVITEEDRHRLLEARLDNHILQGRLQEAQQLLEGRRDPRSRLAMATVLYYRGRFRESLEMSRSVLTSDDAAVAQDATTFATSCLLRRGALAEAAEVFRPMQRLLAAPQSERENTVYAAYLEHVHAHGRAISGDLPAAERIVTSTYERDIARHESGAINAVALGFILLERGKVRTALNILHPVVTRNIHWSLFTQWAQADAVICAAVLRRTAAMDRYVRLLPPVENTIEACDNRIARAWHAAVHHDQPLVRALLVQAAEESLDREQYLHAVWAVHAMGRLGVADAAAPFWDVPVEGAYMNAQLDYTRALAKDDVRLLTRTAATFRAAGADLYAAEAFAELAHRLRRSGEHRQAVAAARQASEAAGRCEGARTPALELLTTVRTPVALTERERQVALLAASGTASREIAETLQLSVRTVNNHLQHVYAKLGVTCRRELRSELGS
ncbi:LuxR C-terminal-related transcriptional regulator [Streptomyces sp. NPDC049040]|uniref:LuxR C-terminal-related transcriptional regulator n=1 Tax=Streptomyces sp. NPDC049040 TaxID=3365593 RepID=UPI003720DF59